MTSTVNDLIAQMTLEEKVALAAGSDFWHTTPIPRLGIPRLKVTDGPNGARGAQWDGVSAACFPCGTALGATWNTALVRQVGEALADEVKSKGAHALLAPTVNIHRSPLGGRNFECYSEDPYLTSRMAVAYISGLQSKQVSATIKHFVANDSEFERQTINSDVDERTLREIYLPPFEAAVREAGVWAIMTAYNRVNGAFAAENALLETLVRSEWGFDGLFMSDWFGTKSTAASANAGLDLEMPGPAKFMGEKLLEAVRAGEVSEAAVERMARNVLRLAERTGALAQTTEPEERAIDRPEHRAIGRQAAAEAIVLLKNDADLLPLEPSSLKTLAVIGPNAEVTTIQGGGSAQVKPHAAVNILSGVRAACGAGVEVVFERGCSIDKIAPPLDERLLAAPGLTFEYFANPTLEGQPVHTETAPSGRRMWMGAPAGLDPHAFSVRARGRMLARESGTHRLTLSGVGRSRLFLDGQPVIDDWDGWKPGSTFFGMGSDEQNTEITLEAGQSVEVRLEFSASPGFFSAVSLGASEPVPADALERAVKVAARCDAAIVVVGTNADWETEGADRTSMGLPGGQVELIERVAAANPRTVVVVNAGSPVEMGWVQHVPAALVSWFGGQEAGNALADVLFGVQNPSGRLPTTFPERLEDTPAFINYPGENGHVRYGEGVFVGYRYYDRKLVAPRFPFGHGLSYTRFEYGPLEASGDQFTANETLKASLEVRNTGNRAGFEVVQLYVHDHESRVARPERELKAFAKVWLEPGETKRVELTLPPRSFEFWDTASHAWVAEPGTFELSAGASSRDLRSRATVTLTSA